VSFLYPEPYYRRLILNAQRKFGISGLSESQDPDEDSDEEELVTIWTLYPGFIDAETFIARVRRYLDQADLEGRPYGAVVLDGIHNLLLEFPLLQADELLWPCVFRLLRSKGIRAVSTFTFFDAEAAHREIETSTRGQSVAEHTELFFHLLVSGCDYSCVLNRDEDDGQVTVKVVTSASEGLRVGAEYDWDAGPMVLRPRIAK
jgi:hypothetical protein